MLEQIEYILELTPLFIYSFIHSFWLYKVLVVARGIFSCDMRDLLVAACAELTPLNYFSLF